MKNKSENTEADFSDFKNDNEQLFSFVRYMFESLRKKDKRNLRSILSKSFKEKCDILESIDLPIKETVEYFIDAVAEERLYFDPKKNWYHMLTDPTNVGKIAYILAMLINENFVSAEVSKIGTEIHKRLSPMILDIVGIKKNPYAVALSTSGGTEANLIALKLALYDITKRLGYSLREDGLFGMKKIPKILIPDTVHFSFEQIAQTLGIGINNLVKIQTTDFRVSANDLKIALANLKENDLLIAIVSVFGATETGAYDDLPGIAKVIKEYKKDHEVWWHIDAAYGGPFLALYQFATYKEAVDYADSVTIDAHKHLWTPFGAGFLCVKNVVVFRNITTDASYIGNTTIHMTDDEYVKDFFNHVGGVRPVGSILSSGVMSTYLTLVALGEDKIKKALEQTMTITKMLAEKLVRSESKLPIIITSGQKLNLLTFKPETGSLTTDNMLVKAITKHLAENTENGILVSETDLNKGKEGERIWVNRICIMSPLANEFDVDEFVATYKRAIEVVTK